MSSDLNRLLGSRPDSPSITSYLDSLASKASKQGTATPEVKSYPDAVYFNYYALGLSILFRPVDGYRPKTGLMLEGLDCQNLILDGIDIYNVPTLKEGAKTDASTTTKAKSTVTYAAYPCYPIIVKLVPLPTDAEGEPRSQLISVTTETTGKDFVAIMGEPDRKGGGAGPSSGSINIWCEWSKDGVMVEFAGADSRGPQAWERGKDAIWKVVSIFPPKTN